MSRIDAVGEGVPSHQIECDAERVLHSVYESESQGSAL